MRAWMAVLVTVLVACGGPGGTGGRTGDEAPISSATTGAVAPAAASFPAVVDDLAAIIPGDSSFVVELPDAAKLAEFATPEQRALLALGMPQAEAAIGEKLHIAPAVVHRIIDSFERASIFGNKKAVALVARFRDGKPVEELLRSKLIEPIAEESRPGTRVIARSAMLGEGRVAWFPQSRVLLVTSSSSLLEAVERTATQQKPAFAANPKRVALDVGSLRVYADLGALASKERELAGLVDAGSHVRGSIGHGEKGLRSKFDLSLVGPRLPAWDDIFVPKAPALAARMPEETLGFISIATGRRQGRTLREAASEIARASGDLDPQGMLLSLDRLAKDRIGFDLADLDALVGDEMVLGGFAAPGKTFDLDDPASKGKYDDVLFYVAIQTRDDAKAKALVGGIGAFAKKSNLLKDFNVSTAGDALRLEPKTSDAPRIRLEMKKGVVLLGVGGAKLMDRLGRSVERGERTLGGAPAYRANAEAFAVPATGFLWMDANRVMQTVKSPAAFPDNTALMGRAVLGRSDKGLDLALEGLNGMEVAVIGSGAAMAIYGVRRYLVSAKTAEAKNTIGAIARGAVGAFERETLDPKGKLATHQLCKNAKAVPPTVPKGTKYQPNGEPGADFETGDAAAGWRCLKFTMTRPHYFQYEYRRGGPYKGPPRGGPDPGPNGFEASAEGDLDGDGKTSLFTLIGTVNPKTQTVTISKEIFIVDEFE